MGNEITIGLVNETVAGWMPDLQTFLAAGMDPQAFQRSAASCLIHNPKIFEECTHDSIKKALIKAAQDGLRPDGKEGALVKYYNKEAVVLDEKGNERKGAHEAQWMPMVAGVRKKAREKDNIFIVAEVVHKADSFIVYKGDDPRIEHTPAPFDADPGEIIASYAIFKQGDDILHREVMRKKDIDSVRAASKSPNSPAWNNWYGEMAKKAAINRGAKSVPMSDAVSQVIARDNDFYDLTANRDEPKPGVDLASRFSGARSVEGFSGGNAARQLTSGRGDTIDMRASNEGDKVETSRSQESTGRTETRAAGDQKEQQQSNVPLRQRKTFEDFSKALLRYGSPETVGRGNDEFWQENGGKPEEDGADRTLARFIVQIHHRRAGGDMDAEEAKAEIAKAIDEAFTL